MNRPRTADAARGKWKGVLLALGLPAAALTGKHAACPACGGKDRFRFTNLEGSGSYVCAQCGNGTSGFGLLEKVKGWDFATAAKEVDQVLGGLGNDPKPRPAMNEACRRELLNGLWKSGQRVQAGDPVSAYLASRQLPLPASLDVLRFVARAPAPHGAGEHPAMVAKVAGVDGRPVQLHRTFLAVGGHGKASIAHPRALMPGEVPAGAAIRLAPHGDRLGIAEGIETALAATVQFGVPVWAAINSTMLEKWTPPPGVTTVMVFGDADRAFGGQAAAYALAHRLSVTGLRVDVSVPRGYGRDWADELIDQQVAA